MEDFLGRWGKWHPRGLRGHSRNGSDAPRFAASVDTCVNYVRAISGSR